MTVVVPKAAPGMGVGAFGRHWRIAVSVAVLALLLAAAGGVGWAMRGGGDGVSVAGAAARYEPLADVVNDRCGNNAIATEATWAGRAPAQNACAGALGMFAAAVRNNVWPETAVGDARRLANAVETHAMWTARLARAPTWAEYQAVQGEMIALYPENPWMVTTNAAAAFRDALGLAGGPTPLV